ncbi:MAG: NYN domain-containing protein [Planctomycetota bacterium]|nr:NYN domain-containing protein [Planctomycetota bacterium]
MGEPRAHVALLVDFANLRLQLSAEGTDAADVQNDGRAIARSLVDFAGGIGRLGLARAYADWSREPQLARALNGTRLAPVLVPATEDGEDRSHIRLTVDAMESLYNGDEPDAYVLVSSDPSLVPLVQALRSDGSEVTVVAADASQADEMATEADQFVTFADVVGGERPEALVLRPERGRAAATPAPEGPTRGRAKQGARREGQYASLPLLTDSDFGDYDWTGFIRLIDELEQRLPFVGVRYLVNKVLGPHNCGIDDPRIKRDLINEAVDDGLIEMYTVGNVNERTDPVTACRLDRENELVMEILGGLDEEEMADGDEADADVHDGAEELSTSAH